MKQENEQLKKDKAYSDSIADEYRYKEQQEEYIRLMKKYAVAIINYQECYGEEKPNPFSEEKVKKYRSVWDVSVVLEVPVNIPEDEKQRLLDERFYNKVALLYPNILLKKDLYLFDSYSEASQFMEEKRRLYYEED